MEALEEARKKYVKKLGILITVAFIIFGIAIVFAVLMTFSFGNNPILGTMSFMPLPFLIIFIIIVIIIGILATRKDAEAYKKQYKAYFVEKSLNKFFTDLKYSHDSGMPREVLRETGMIRTGDRYSSNDFTSGKYKEVNFRQADVKVEEEHSDSDGGTEYVTIFKGRWMEFEFPKSFNFRSVFFKPEFLLY